MLFPREGGLPGDPDRCGVYGLNLELPGRCSWHWKPEGKQNESEEDRARLMDSEREKKRGLRDSKNAEQ